MHKWLYNLYCNCYECLKIYHFKCLWILTFSISQELLMLSDQDNLEKHFWALKLHARSKVAWTWHAPCPSFMHPWIEGPLVIFLTQTLSQKTLGPVAPRLFGLRSCLWCDLWFAFGKIPRVAFQGRFNVKAAWQTWCYTSNGPGNVRDSIFGCFIQKGEINYILY